VENVVMDANAETKESGQRISATMGVEPVLLDSNSLLAASRPRNYWSNLTVPALTPCQVSATSALDEGWMPLWDFGRSASRPGHFNTFLRGFPPGRPDEVPAEFKTFSRLPLHCYQRNSLVVKNPLSAEEKKVVQDWVTKSVDIKYVRELGSPSIRARGELARWIHTEGGHSLLRPPHGRERERAMGYPVGSSALPSDPSDVTSQEGHFVLPQFQATGNAFAVNVVAHVLKPYCAHLVNGSPLNLQSGHPKVESKEAALSALVPSGSGGQSR